MLNVVSVSAPRRPGRPTRNVRVPDLDPHAFALAFTRDCLKHGHQYARQLDPLVVAYDAHDEAVAKTAVYKRARRLAEYAVRGTAPRTGVEELAKPFETFASSPLWDRVDLERVRHSVNTQQGRDSAMALVLVAAVCREKIGRGESVTSSELAALSGLTRSMVGTHAREGQLRTEGEARRGTGGEHVISAPEALRWLRERGALGFDGAVPPARSPHSARGKDQD